MEELDQMLEDDALVLLNMKKDITISQKEELLKMKENVLSIKKEHNALLVVNTALDKTLRSLADKQAALDGVDKASLSSAVSVQSRAQSMEEQAAVVLEAYAAEQRTVKMLHLMIKRLDKEIAKCRVDTAKAVVVVEHAKHDLVVTEATLQASKQDLVVQESQLDKLNSTLKSRKDQREKKLSMLHTLSVDGDNSVTRLQNSLMETTKVSLYTLLFYKKVCSLNIYIS